MTRIFLLALGAGLCVGVLLMALAGYDGFTIITAAFVLALGYGLVWVALNRIADLPRIGRRR